MQAQSKHCAAGGPPWALVLPSRLLSSLRARRGLGSRQGSRASIAVAERSELRAAGSQEGSTPQPPPQPPPVPLPTGPELLRQHLSPTQCEHVTHEILRTFLAVDGSSSGGNGSSRAGRRHAAGHAGSDRGSSSSNGSKHVAEHSVSSSSSSARSPLQHVQGRPKTSGRGSRGSKSGMSAAGAAPAQERRRGLQGQVAEHLLSGGFDEALLEPVPTHTLNWVIKVRNWSVYCCEASRCGMPVPRVVMLAAAYAPRRRQMHMVVATLLAPAWPALSSVRNLLSASLAAGAGTGRAAAAGAGRAAVPLDASQGPGQRVQVQRGMDDPGRFACFSWLYADVASNCVS